MRATKGMNITMELWDAYDAYGNQTGETLVRGKEIPAGRYHMVCEVLVRHADGSILCMKRASTKPNYPGFYEATAGGSALQGEEPLACIRRELLEETGLTEQDVESVALRYITLRLKNEEVRQNYYFFADLKENAVLKTDCNEGKLEWGFIC